MPIALGIIGIGVLAFALIKMAENASAQTGSPSSSSTGTSPAPNTNGSSAVTLSGSGAQSAGQLVNDLMSSGLTRTASAGIVGNLQQESSLNPGDPGGGLAQWQGSRWTDLVNFAQSHGLAPASARGQLDFLASDLNSSYASLKAQLNAASSPEQAALLFSSIYERPGNPQNQNRTIYARQAFTASGG